VGKEPSYECGRVCTDLIPYRLAFRDDSTGDRLND